MLPVPNSPLAGPVPVSFITSRLPGIVVEPISHNFGRRSKGSLSITGICIHETAAHGDPRGWFDNPTAQASATYCVMQTGMIKQYVAESVRAWAQGIPAVLWDPQYSGPNKPAWPFLRPFTDPNDYLVAIESEKTDADAWTAPQLDSLTSLMADIAFRYSFLLDNMHVVRHHDIWAGHLCPGAACPFDQILLTSSQKLALLNSPSPVSPTT